MGSQSKYKEKELVSVRMIVPTAAAPPAAATPGLIYCFWTNIPNSDRAELGHTPVADPRNPDAGSVLGATYPKPPRAGKRYLGTPRFTSSFCDKSRIRALKLAGWRISKNSSLPKLQTEALTPNSFVRTVYVTIKAIKYAWNIPLVTLNHIKAAVPNGGGGITIPNIKEATASDYDELCIGANAPKPPRASFVMAHPLSSDPATIQTFFDPDRTLVNPWQPTKSGVYAFA